MRSASGWASPWGFCCTAPCETDNPPIVTASFLLLALIGGAAASFLIYDEFIDDDDDNPRDQDVGTPGDGPLPGNPDDADDPDTPDLSGDDTLSASGNERVYGGEGRDLLDLSDNAVGFGQIGVDRLDINETATGYGGEGQDRLNIFDDATGFGVEADDNLEAVQRGDASAFGEGGDGDDTIDGRVQSTIHGNAGNDNLRVQGNASISDVEAGDRLTLVLSDDVTNIDITVNNDGCAPIDPITIELTDDWISGDDVALRVVELTETRNWVYVSIGGEQVIRLDFVDGPDAPQFNVVRV
ncbi:hypothetical protein FIU89_02905 [Roseovarius sp. THAF27]|uniref:hypothetical protein n=1 Tax=Roseovarius sp. THAF27 TaxID=2587850 RepID=UPI001267DB11|nr:hypothetical protein [Roseovarius sp. THAF27]QFT79546.1 hypothetical protein FIU89_02905 [Roseovarius sp. THAF27]